MDSIIGTFHIDWKIMLAQAFNFGVVFVVLYLFALKPLMKIMKERTDKIQQGINDAKSNALLLNETKVKYDEAVARARAEADKIFQEGKKEAENKRSIMMQKTEEEIALMIENGKKNLESEREKMIKEVKGEIIAVSVKIAEKILGKSIDQKFDERTMKELESM